MNRLALAATLPLLLTAPAFAQGRGERPETFVNVATVAPALIVEARYAGSHNFVGDKIDGYEKPICYLTRTAAAALAQVVADLEPRGLTLKAFDCYRPERAVAHFVRWARNVGDVKTKAEFYPQVDKSTLFADGYIAARSGHSRGSTVDLTLARRSDGRELPMGTPFDFFSPRSWPSDRSVSGEAQANRALLAQVMRNRGFLAYNKEWWHFTLRHEPYPETYFNFPVR
jgi:D-alanyl-D-alanine dipeptidase